MPKVIIEISYHILDQVMMIITWLNYVLVWIKVGICNSYNLVTIAEELIKIDTYLTKEF